MSYHEFKANIYTDISDITIIQQIQKVYPHLNFITRNEKEWDIRYITSIIMDPNLKLIIIHDINDMSIAEITLGSFMCKHILCVTSAIKEYNKIFDMVNDLQLGCKLTEANTTFINWFKSIKL